MSKPRSSPKRPREEKARARRRKVSIADSVGRRVPPTIEAYERVAKKGEKKLAQALIARHNLRMEAIRSTTDDRMLLILHSLPPITVLDIALLRAGASRHRPPAAYTGDWADHLAWGVDSAVSAIRLLLCGQIIGAAALVRNQLERWTLHRATNSRLEQQRGESTTDFIARVWTAEDKFHEDWFSATPGITGDLAEPEGDATEPSAQHRHLTTSDGREICPAMLYMLLSEVMHGRELIDAIAWDSNGLLAGEEWPDEMYVAVAAIVDTVTLCLRELRAAVVALVERVKGASAEPLRQTLDTFSEAQEDTDDAPVSSDTVPMPQGLVAPPLITLMPLLPREGLSPDVTQAVDRLAAQYEEVLAGRRPAGRLFRDDEITTYAFAWHRMRSIRTARRALVMEKRMLGDDFSIESLAGRASRWTLLTEAVSLLGKWHRRPEAAAAAALIGTALRSSYWLWLEDDDRAMSTLRCVLEQAARLRTWRLKPLKAENLEQRIETTPRDWIEAAGWKRLTALNRALGELAHTKATSRWSGARELLAKFQIGVDEDKAIYTARGASIDFVAQLVAQELCAGVSTISSTISNTLGTLFLQVGYDLSPESVEATFDTIWSHRQAPLGSSEFTLMPQLWLH